MMHERRVRGAAALLSFVLFACGTFQMDGGVSAKEKNIVDTGFSVTSVGSYDSADTAVVISVDQENRGITFLNMDTGKQYTLYYDGTTYFKDKYEGPMTVSQLQPGDVVDVNFLKGKREIASVQISPQAWSYENIDNYDLGGMNHTASIGSSVFSLPEEAAVLSEGKQVSNMEIVKQDVVTIRGIDHQIYSISVEKGHGYLRLKNDEALIGGWIEIGNAVISQITEDMLLTVPEGSYQVLLSNGKASSVKQVEIERNKELILDVGDVQVEEDKTGKITFSVNPATAKVSVDDQEIDTSQIIELPYGIHRVYIEADGYYPMQKHIQVGSEYADISFSLDPKPEEESVSENSVNETVKEEEPEQEETTKTKVEDEVIPFKQSVSENTATSVSANSTSTNNKVYVDVKDGQEGVSVYLDGYWIGEAPTAFKKVTGSHILSLRKEGYHTRSYTIYLYNDGEDVTYSCAALVKEEDETETDTAGTGTSGSSSATDSGTSSGSSATDPGTSSGSSTTDPGTSSGSSTTDPGTSSGSSTTDPGTSSGSSTTDPGTSGGSSATDPGTSGGSSATDPGESGSSSATDPGESGGSSATDPGESGGSSATDPGESGGSSTTDPGESGGGSSTTDPGESGGSSATDPGESGGGTTDPENSNLAGILSEE